MRSPSILSRRRFLGLGGAAFAGGLLPSQSLGEKSDVRIERVTSFTVTSERWKVVGKNSHLESHGKVARDRVLRIEIAEQDPAQTEVFDASGFELRDGKVQVPDTPGCGLSLRPKELADIEIDWQVP